MATLPWVVPTWCWSLSPPGEGPPPGGCCHQFGIGVMPVVVSGSLIGWARCWCVWFTCGCPQYTHSTKPLLFSPSFWLKAASFVYRSMELIFFSPGTFYLVAALHTVVASQREGKWKIFTSHIWVRLKHSPKKTKEIFYIFNICYLYTCYLIQWFCHLVYCFF